MVSSVVADMDFIEELRLRRWARENYVPPDERKDSWHPIIQEEMEQKDLDSAVPTVTSAYAWAGR